MKNTPWISLIALVAANLAVLHFALEGEYAVFSVLFLYWAESAIIGFYAFLKILLYKGGFSPLRLLTTGFFLVHFGAFMLAHFFIVLAFMPKEIQTSPDYVALMVGVIAGLLTPLLSLFASHTVSFITNFIGKKEYERVVTFVDPSMAPYKRIILMQVTLILGALAAQAVGTSYVVIVLMVLLKTLVDLHAHLREHRY